MSRNQKIIIAIENDKVKSKKEQNNLTTKKPKAKNGLVSIKLYGWKKKKKWFFLTKSKVSPLYQSVANNGNDSEKAYDIELPSF